MLCITVMWYLNKYEIRFIKVQRYFTIICEMMLMDRKKTKDLFKLFGLKEHIAGHPKGKVLLWYSHVL